MIRQSLAFISWSGFSVQCSSFLPRAVASTFFSSAARACVNASLSLLPLGLAFLAFGSSEAAFRLFLALALRRRAYRSMLD